MCLCVFIKERDCQTQPLISSPNLSCPIFSTESKWHPHKNKQHPYPPILYTARNFLFPLWPHGTHRGRWAWFFSKINVQILVSSCSSLQSPWSRPTSISCRENISGFFIGLSFFPYSPLVHSPWRGHCVSLWGKKMFFFIVVTYT